MEYTVHVAIFIYYHNILRAKLNFPLYLQDNKSITKGKILAIYQFATCYKTPFFSVINNTDFAAFYLSCEYKYFKTK